MRRYGEPVEPGRTYRSRPGAYAIVRESGDLLVTEQSDPTPEIQLPGGGIDPHEGALQALHRECIEETGWTIRVIRRLGAFQRYTYVAEQGAWARKVCHIYLARPALRHGTPREPGHQALWMPVETAARLLADPGSRAFVAHLARAQNRRLASRGEVR